MSELTDLILAARGTLNPLKLILAGGDVKRYHSEDVPPQSVAAHSWRVAVIAAGLWPTRPQLVMAALYHDCAEGLLGDIPAPAKRWPGVRAAFTDLEAEYENFLDVDRFLNLLPEDRSRLKVADYLELVLYCRSKPGEDARRAEANARAYVREAVANLPEEEQVRVLKMLEPTRHPDKTGQDRPFGFVAEEERRPEHRAAFDIGNGRIGYGDRIELVPTGRLGTVAQVLHDGDVDINLDDGKGPFTVKWRQIRKVT